MNRADGGAKGRVGLYVHIPFCKSRCIYCDFVSCTQTPDQERYVNRLVNEWRARRSMVKRSEITSLYIGGGTPSLFSPNIFTPLLDEVNGAKGNKPEVTVEVNPGDVDEGWFSDMLILGVNRFSIGIQAMDDERLSFLGRRHTVADGVNAVKAARRAGCDNISVDYIYGTPDHDEEQAMEELIRLQDLGPDHISVYELTVAEGTPLFRMSDSLPMPGDQQLAELWIRLRDVLIHQGYEHYEVSNYARPGKQSVHNEHYWRGGVYVGLGAGAYGTVMADGQMVRYANTAALSRYLEEDVTAPVVGVGQEGGPEPISALDRARELVMMGLRTSRGVEMGVLGELLDEQQHRAFFETFRQIETEGHIRHHNGFAVPSLRGMALADELSLRFF